MRKVISTLAALALVGVLAACSAIAPEAQSPYVSLTLQIVDASNSPIPNVTIESTPWDAPGKEFIAEQTTDENGCLRIEKATTGSHDLNVYLGEEHRWEGRYEINVTRESDGGTLTLVCDGAQTPDDDSSQAS